MEQKIIDWAIDIGWVESVEELESLNEEWQDIVKTGYKQSNDIIKIKHYMTVELNSGIKVDVKPFYSYWDEPAPSAWKRELKNVGVEYADDITFDDLLNLYNENYELALANTDQDGYTITKVPDETIIILKNFNIDDVVSMYPLRQS